MDLTTRLGQRYLDRHPEEAAEVLVTLPAEEAVPMIAAVSPDSAAAALQRLPVSWAASLLNRLPAASAAPVFTALPIEWQVNLLRQLDETARERQLASIPPQLAKPLRRLLPYPGGTAASLMDPHVFAVADDLTVQEALKRTKLDTEHLRFYIYLVDAGFRLTGVLTLRELMQAGPKRRVADLARRPVMSINAAQRLQEIVTSPHWHRVPTLPVVEADGTLLGLLRYKTLRGIEDELEQRSHEDAALSTLLALGELYWLGMSGIFRGLAVPEPRENEPPEESGP